MPRALSRATLEHPVKAFRLPSERHGPGFERAAATAAFDGAPPKFPHDDRGHARAYRELALTPAELAGTAADSPGNRSPVLRIAFRHAFLRVPTSSAETSRSLHAPASGRDQPQADEGTP
jgi:hypothetical protein